MPEGPGPAPELRRTLSLTALTLYGLGTTVGAQSLQASATGAEEDALERWPIEGHFRWNGPPGG